MRRDLLTRRKWRSAVEINLSELVPLATQAMIEREREQARLRRIADYVRGKHDPPYAPKGVNAEYRWIMKKARRNFLRPVISVISQNLHVDGYRPTGTTANEALLPQKPQPQWEAFRANRMISRQHGVHRSVIKYGSAYTVVLPGQMASDEERQGNNVPVVRPVSPRRLTAFYADDVDDEWPQFAIEARSVKIPGGKSQAFVSVYDEARRYILAGQPGITQVQQLGLQLADAADPLL